MDSSNPYYDKPSAPSMLSSGSNYSSATGIPVSSSNQYYPSAAPVRAPLHIVSRPHVPWSTGLCGCHEDCGNCCLTFWCPCITFGRMAEIVDRGATSCGTAGALYTLIMLVTGCACLYSCSYRSKLRKQYSLKEKPCWDCFVHCCCEPCALCQEYRQLKLLGFEMRLGWQGNVEKQTRGVTTLPPAIGAMTR